MYILKIFTDISVLLYGWHSLSHVEIFACVKIFDCVDQRHRHLSIRKLTQLQTPKYFGMRKTMLTALQNHFKVSILHSTHPHSTHHRSRGQDLERLQNHLINEKHIVYIFTLSAGMQDWYTDELMHVYYLSYLAL